MSVSNNIVFLGDSIVEFWKEKDNSFFELNFYINKGISGQTTSQMLNRFHQDVIQLFPKKVVILAGINDIAENTGPITINQIFENIKKMIDLARTNSIDIILCSILPANNFYWNSKIKPAEKVIELNKLLNQYAIDNNLCFVDYYSKMVDKNKGLLKVYGEDGVHPNENGYKIMKETLVPFLEY